MARETFSDGLEPIPVKLEERTACLGLIISVNRPLLEDRVRLLTVQSLDSRPPTDRDAAKLMLPVIEQVWRLNL